jgi:hypothetical protein
MTTANPLDPGQSRSFTWVGTKRNVQARQRRRRHMAAAVVKRGSEPTQLLTRGIHPIPGRAPPTSEKHRTTRRLASTFHLLRGAGVRSLSARAAASGRRLASGPRTRVQGRLLAAATCVVMAASDCRPKPRRSSLFNRERTIASIECCTDPLPRKNTASS